MHVGGTQDPGPAGGARYPLPASQEPGPEAQRELVARLHDLDGLMRLDVHALEDLLCTPGLTAADLHEPHASVERELQAEHAWVSAHPYSEDEALIATVERGEHKARAQLLASVEHCMRAALGDLSHEVGLRVGGAGAADRHLALYRGQIASAQGARTWLAGGAPVDLDTALLTVEAAAVRRGRAAVIYQVQDLAHRLGHRAIQPSAWSVATLSALNMLRQFDAMLDLYETAAPKSGVLPQAMMDHAYAEQVSRAAGRDAILHDKTAEALTRVSELCGPYDELQEMFDGDFLQAVRQLRDNCVAFAQAVKSANQSGVQAIDELLADLAQGADAHSASMLDQLCEAPSPQSEATTGLVEVDWSLAAFRFALERAISAGRIGVSDGSKPLLEALSKAARAFKAAEVGAVVKSPVAALSRTVAGYLVCPLEQRADDDQRRVDALRLLLLLPAEARYFLDAGPAGWMLPP